MFFAFCLVPLLFMFIKPAGDLAANEVKSGLPHFADGDGKINNNYTKELSDWFDKNFGLRDFLIGAERRIMAAVFGESTEKKVILGKDGWLFYEETLDDYEGTNLMSEREIYSAAKTLELVEEYLQSNGIKFAFAPVPNKNTLYPGKMPERYPKSPYKSDMERLKEALRDTGVEYVDILEAFRREKVLYRKSDSHWTTEGAGLASDTILKALDKPHNPIYGTKTKKKDNGPGDLYEMLYVRGREYESDTVYTREHSFRYSRPIRSYEDNFIYTDNDKEGRLYMYRDSFGNTLHPFLADEFQNCTFTRILPYNLEAAKKDNADYVVIELVERNLRKLITDGAVFPAPQRETEKSNLTDITDMTDIKISDDKMIEGCMRADGIIQKDLFRDGKEKIIIVSDGISYEATPRGEDAFCAYIPKGEEIFIYLMR